MGARSAGLRVLLAAVLVGGGCGGGKSTPDAAPGDAPSGTDAACPGAYERITAEDSGHELAVAYREHVPTMPEKVMAVALYAVLIRAAAEGSLDDDLFRRLAAEGTLSAIPGLYPTAFRPCGAAIPATQGAVISDPFQCTDDCRISRDEVFAILVAPLVIGLRLLGTQSTLLGEVIKLTNNMKMALADPALTGQALQDAVAMAMAEVNVDAFLTTVFEAIGKAAAVAAGVAELINAGQVGPALAAAAAVIAMGVVALRLQMLANKINACRQWKAENCRCMGPNCGCAALGFNARGVMCCGQGGPTVDGQGWYVATASPTCCVLNRAEYSKHSQMCWAPPDKHPGPCPDCLSDAECCDRTGAPGNIDSCVAGRCCGRDGPARPNTPTMVDFSCCSGVRYQVNATERTCAPAP